MPPPWYEDVLLEVEEPRFQQVVQVELHEVLEEDEVTTKVATLRQVDQRECTQRSEYSRVSGKGDTETTITMEPSHYHEHVQIG